MRTIAFLLLLAASLKMYGLAVEPVGAMGIFSEPWLQTAVVEWEIILGLWLIWGQHRAAAWFFATGTFLVFSGVSFWQGSIGQSSCGCFGNIHVNPWLSFGIDLTALALLFAIRKQCSLTSPWIKLINFRQLAVVPIGVLLIMGILAGTSTVIFGSPGAGIAYLRGETLAVRPLLLNVGTGSQGDRKDFEVRLTNWTGHTIRVLGGTSDCSCVLTNDLPLTIAAGESSTAIVKITWTGRPGQFTRIAHFFTDDSRARKVTVRLTGRTLEQQAAIAE